MDANVFETANAGFAQVMYEEFLRDPASVGPEWRRLFESGVRGEEPSGVHASITRPAGGNGASGDGAAGSPAPTRAAAPATPAAAAAPLPPNAQPLKGPAAKLVANMNESLTVPTATTFRELPVAVLDARRRELNGALKAAGRDAKVSFTHLIAWAIVQATKRYPVMGHTLAMHDGTPHRVTPDAVSLGLAVDVTRKDGTRGLVVPVLKRADAMDFAAFHAAYEQIVEKARTNKLMPDDFAGATMSLTNPGGLGTVASVPRLMAGQGSIIAVGAIGYPPEFDATPPEQIQALGLSKVMTVTSTYDHRVIQGAESGEFLKTLDEMLQGGHEFYEGVFQALGLGAPKAIAKPSAPAAAPAVKTVAAAPAAGTAAAGGLAPATVAAAMRLVEAIRGQGHMAACFNPLGDQAPDASPVDPATYGLDEAALAAIPAAALDIEGLGATLAEALPKLREIYCGTTAYEFAHISNRRQREWLRAAVERGEFRRPLSADERRWLLGRLTQVETFERFLHKAYLGQKRFSVEGVDAVVPMLDVAMDVAANAGATEVVLGMAHRGRLNVLVHTAGRPYETILGEFEGLKKTADGETSDDAGESAGTGDVKYHLGAEGVITTPSGREVTVTLAPNPSHLEFVGAVVVGRARARQSDRSTNPVTHEPSRVLPVVLHGDAAFAGQGVVAETFNMSGLRGYDVGGTLHIIENNQVGFTTDWEDARSTRYASDLAKGFDVPIVHVNADDPEACLGAVRLLMAYRQEFGRDVLIDLVGYRRHGHNEGDEPTYTQPRMYARIKELPTVRARYAERLAAEGVVPAEQAEQEVQTVYGRLVELQQQVKSRAAEAKDGAAAAKSARAAGRPSGAVRTAVAAERLTELNEALLTWPDGFTVNPKLKKQLERRRTAAGPEGGMDWGHAEALAFASLLADGVPIRLTGQDVERGTFSHRHVVLHDAATGEELAPVQRLPQAKASFEIHNSPLSELAAIGFEYGYNVAAPEALVLWEAQFGDFVNGAQVMLDQFLSASLTKWGETSRLTLLLPHGFEGQGPEHSSARLERFLQLAAEENLRVANCSTPAQYFHLLRRQATDRRRRPLVVMMPKSLLRLPQAASRLQELAEGTFQPVIDDAGASARAAGVHRVVLCSGKVYYDLLAEAEKMGEEWPAVVRVEQLYPFPAEELRTVLGRYAQAREVVWCQEEPRNMGAWSFVAPQLRELLDEGVTLEYAGRPERASPAEGYASAHQAEQHRLVAQALGKDRERGTYATTAAAGDAKS